MCLFYSYANAKIEIHICSNKHETGLVYHVFSSTVTSFKNSPNFASIQKTLVTNFIGRVIG